MRIFLYLNFKVNKNRLITTNVAQNNLLVNDKFSEIDTKHNNKIEMDKYFKFEVLVLGHLLNILKFDLESFRFE